MRNDREPAIMEPCPIAQIYCDGLAGVEIAKSGNAWLNFYAEQRGFCCDGEGRIERILVARLVIPQAGLMEAVAKILTAQGTTQAPWASHAMGGRA